MPTAVEFLRLDGITGESTDKAHPGEIEVMAFSFGVQNATTVGSATGGGGAGKASFQDIHITALTTKASPTLFLNCVSGKHIPTGTITCRKAGGRNDATQDFLKIKLQDVLVSSYSIGSHPIDDGFSLIAGGDANQPTDEFTLSFAKIEFDYLSSDGSLVNTAWDQLANAPVTSLG